MLIANKSSAPANPDEPVEARPASTVVLLRESATGLETLMLKRNKALMFAGGLWVFPGGALDAADLEQAGGDVEQASRIAACREAQEEAGISPDISTLIPLSHWTTPAAEPKRFATWIYAAPIDAGLEAIIDGSEIHESCWMSVQDAIAAHKRGEFGVLPPTFITLSDLCRFDTVADVLASHARQTPPRVLPVLTFEGKRPITLYAGDAGYEHRDNTVPGARHRAILVDKVWQYTHEGVDPRYPALIGS